LSEAKFITIVLRFCLKDSGRHPSARTDPALAPPTLEFGKPDARVRPLACRENVKLLGTSQHSPIRVHNIGYDITVKS
jgi:hypothetical protein